MLPLDFPIELLLSISSHLMLPDLQQFANVSPTLRDALASTVERHRQFQEEYKITGNVWRHHRPTRHALLQDILFDLLRNPEAGQYVKRLEIDNPRDLGEEYTSKLSDKERGMLVNALAGAPFMHKTFTDEPPEILRKAGDDDVILGLLLHLVPNLKGIVLPAGCWGGVNLESALEVVQRIALSPKQPSPYLPLANLVHIEGSVFNGFYGIDLEGLTYFMLLPSLRTIAADWVHEDEFKWPESVPKSRVESIKMRNSTVTSAAIKGFAKGLMGPCKIYHEWGYRRHHTMPQPNNDWDYFAVPFEGAGEEDWIMRNPVEEQESAAEEYEDDESCLFRYDEEKGIWFNIMQDDHGGFEEPLDVLISDRQ